MKNTAFILCLIGTVAEARRSKSVAVVAHRAQDQVLASASPITKVVILLTDLKSKLLADGKVEDTAYDKFACWCEKTGSAKAVGITAAENNLQDQGQSMLQSKGEIGSLNNQIGDTQSDIQAAEDTQSKATSLRTRQNGDYTLTIDEMKQVLAALQQAITVLKASTKPASFLQQGTSAVNAIRAVIEVLPPSANLQPKQTALLSEFSKTNEGAHYAPQSATVQGILADMYLEFAASLEAAMETEARRNRDYETLMSTKDTQISGLNTQQTKMEGLRAEEEGVLADTTQDYDDTDAERRADTNVYGDTKGICKEKHDDYVERVRLRKEEIAGIEKALELLTTDSARTLFSSTVRRLQDTQASASFLQVASNSVVQPLEDAARAVGSLRMAALAVKLHDKKAGHFAEVMGEIDTMMAALRAEDQADIKKRDQCRSEYLENNRTEADLQWKLTKAEARLDKIERRSTDIEAEVAETDSSISQTQKELSAMERVRRQENQEYHATVAEDDQAVALLQQAQDAVAAYYSNNSIEMGPIQGSVKSVLAQERAWQPETTFAPFQQPELDLSDKGSRKLEAKGIVSILSSIIADVLASTAGARKTEEIAQLAFEKQAKDGRALVSQLTKKKVNLKLQLASLAQEKDTLLADQQSYQTDLDTEKAYKASIKPDCDFIINSFTKRADARAVEMQGLMKAKDYLAGFKPASLLERQDRPFDDEALGKLSFQGISS